MKTRKNVEPELIEKLRDIVGNEWIVTEKEAVLDHLTDETAPAVCPEPAADMVLVKPGTTQEISGILKLANRGASIAHYRKTDISKNQHIV